jgi:endonuclease YncB( thermonuclease family)
MRLALVVLLALLSPAFAAGESYRASVVRVVDGDTLVVRVPSWRRTPFEQMAVRISAIDTPESQMPPGKCALEVTRGHAASAFAKTLAAPGDKVTLIYHGPDKYFRIDADVRLKDGRDWAAVMIGAGLARPYDGGTKSSWCAP